jgi:hypothetical protein
MKLSSRLRPHIGGALAALVMFTLGSPGAFADGTTATGTLTFVSTETTGVFIQLKSANGALITADPDGCGRNYMFMLDKNHPMFNALYAALLSAFSTGSPTFLKLSGCNGSTGNTWPLVSYVTQGQYQAP